MTCVLLFHFFCYYYIRSKSTFKISAISAGICGAEYGHSVTGERVSLVNRIGSRKEVSIISFFSRNRTENHRNPEHRSSFAFATDNTNALMPLFAIDLILSNCSAFQFERPEYVSSTIAIVISEVGLWSTKPPGAQNEAYGCGRLFFILSTVLITGEPVHQTEMTPTVDGRRRDQPALKRTESCQ